nr:MAG TPA: hypothetical protein [Caudoviricetes sp.]
MGRVTPPINLDKSTFSLLIYFKNLDKLGFLLIFLLFLPFFSIFYDFSLFLLIFLLFFFVIHPIHQFWQVSVAYYILLDLISLAEQLV